MRGCRSAALLVSRSLALRCFVPEDASKLFAMSQQSGIRTWLPDQVYESEAHALEVLRYLVGKCRDPGMPSLGPYVLGVCLRDSEELIGHVGLSPLGGDVEIGYAIEEERQGRGLASEAVRAMSEWALARFALPRIVGIVAAENAASCSVLRKAGFLLVEESIRTLHGRSGLVQTYEKVKAPPIP